ncbi:hypothetical protein ACTFIR_005294 [Dictyostelium discoideum]
MPNLNQRGLKFGKILDIKQVEVFDSDIISISTLDTSSIKCSHGQVLLMVDQLHKTDEQLRIEKKNLVPFKIKRNYFNKKAYNITENGNNFVAKFISPPEFNPFRDLIPSNELKNIKTTSNEPINIRAVLREYSKYLLYGYIIGDGHIPITGEAKITIYEGDIGLFNSAFEFLTSKSITRYSNSNGISNVGVIHINRKSVQEIFLNFFDSTIVGARVNKIEVFPPEILYCDLIFAMAFFRGFYSADGSTFNISSKNHTISTLAGPTKAKTMTVYNDEKYTFLEDLKTVVNNRFGIEYTKDREKPYNSGEISKMGVTPKLKGGISNDTKFGKFISFPLCSHKLTRFNIGYGFKRMNILKTHYDEYNSIEYINKCGASGAFSVKKEDDVPHRVTYGNNISS